jgi:hypothetical protein
MDLLMHLMIEIRRYELGSVSGPQVLLAYEEYRKYTKMRAKSELS